jgi:hypothetical protein
MKYSDDFEGYYEMLIETAYTGLQSLDDLERLTEGVMSLLDLMKVKDEEFTKLVTFQREQFRIDLKLITNAKQRDSEKGIEDGFYESKRQLKIDLNTTALKFRFIGY